MNANSNANSNSASSRNLATITLTVANSPVTLKLETARTRRHFAGHSFSAKSQRNPNYLLEFGFELFDSDLSNNSVFFYSFGFNGAQVLDDFDHEYQISLFRYINALVWNAMKVHEFGCVSKANTTGPVVMRERELLKGSAGREIIDFISSSFEEALQSYLRARDTVVIENENALPPKNK